MKKIISCIILISCIFNMILPISVVYAKENIKYECIQLPIISDKSKEIVTDITLYKDSDILYAPLHTICPLINVEWYMKDGGFYVERDGCTYFRYYSNGDMKLIVDLGVGDDKWNKSDNVLLEGNLFSCKKIGVEWCVDFIKFCDMFGATFFKVSQSTINSAKDKVDSLTESLNNLDIESDLDFINHPYYIYIYSGTPLISLYGQVMGNENLYLWDYSCYENLEQSTEDESWLEETLKNIQYSSITTGLTLQSQNWLSNLVNDNWGITKIIVAPPYKGSEHYKKALVNISCINYSENLKSEDIESINKNNMAKELEQLLNSNSIISSSDSAINILNKYLNANISIPELESFTNLSDVINWIGTPIQTYLEVENFYNKLNSINEYKIQLLTKSIVENEYINKISKIQEKGNNSLSFLNKTMANNILLNSIDNYTGLVDSSKEICSLYKNSDEQLKEKLVQSIESELYALGDSAISKILEKSENPYLVLTGAIIEVYDGFTAWTKQNFGEQLQNSEILVQAYFIEKTMKESLDIKNPENLYNRMVLMLQASLCCFENDKSYFQTNRNKISKMLCILDNDKNINLNYYRDPRNNNLEESLINAIKNYSDTLVVPIEDETNPSEFVEITEVPTESDQSNKNYDVEVISTPLTKNDIIFGTGNITVEEPHCNYPTFRSSNPELQAFLQNNITQDILNELNHNTSNAAATKQITYAPYGDFEFAKVFDHYLQIYQYFTKSWNGGQGEDFNLTYLVDLKTQQVLSLYDLFSDDKEIVRNELIPLLQEKYKNYEWNGGALWDNEEERLPYYNKIGAYTVENLKNINFQITENDITFIFNRGELIPWAKAVLTIPWNEIHLNCIFGAMTSSEEELKNIMSSYGNICAWEYADYDGNGTKEAFAMVGTNSMPDYYISDSIQGVYFISAKGEVKELGKTSNGLMCSIERCTEYAGKKFFSYNATAGGSGSQTYLFSVKNGNCYELSISGTIVDFYSKNNKCYATVSEFLPDGGHVWPEYELIYDESLQEFSLPNNQTNSENQIASTTEQSENVSVSDNQILKAVNKYLTENQSHLGVWLSDGNPYCPAEYMRSSDKKWSCPINLSWESYSGNEMAGAYPHFAYVDKGTLKCTLTANYETVVEFDLSDYIK